MKLEMYSKVLGIHNFILSMIWNTFWTFSRNAILSNNQCVIFTTVEIPYYYFFNFSKNRVGRARRTTNLISFALRKIQRVQNISTKWFSLEKTKNSKTSKQRDFPWKIQRIHFLVEKNKESISKNFWKSRKTK